MKFDREVHEAYQQAHALAMRYQTKAIKYKLPNYPVALNTMMEDRMVSYRQDLGTMDIPTNLIVGVADTTDNSMLYTKEFHPISIPQSDFADHWRDIFYQYSKKHDIAGQIQCYEYLGKFYVVDGLIRVSVLKFLKTPTIRSQVIRIMPFKTDSKDIGQYFDFLCQFQLTGLYQLQFTKKGYFEKLQKALGYACGHQWTDGDRANFLTAWVEIESAYCKAYGECLHITIADALVVLLEKYTFEQIKNMQPWVLTRLFQMFWKQLYDLSFPGETAQAKQFPPKTILQTA